LTHFILFEINKPNQDKKGSQNPINQVGTLQDRVLCSDLPVRKNFKNVIFRVGLGLGERFYSPTHRKMNYSGEPMP